MDTEPYQNFILLLIEIKPLSIGVWIGLIGILFLLFCSGLASGSENSLFSLSPDQRKEIEKSNSPKNKIIVNLLSKPEKLLATILIANNFINVAIVMLSVYVLANTFDYSNAPQWLVVFFEVGVITFIILLFGEILPKIYAGRLKLKFAHFTAYPLNFTMKFFSPVSNLLVNSTSFVNKKFKKKQIISVDELSDALELTESEIKHDKGILRRIVTFGSIDVKEIMKPRIDVVLADLDYSFNKVKSLIIESGYSRIPVFEENPDNIKGVLLIKDLLKHIDDDDYRWQDNMKAPMFVPETMKINDLLEEFRDKKIHIAIVIDEYGGFMGIVTLEDIIEEIVGEISDENDEDNKQFIKLDENNYIWDGKFQINEWYKILDIKDDVFAEYRGETDTIAGLILEVKGEIPKKGETIKIADYSFLILEADNRKIIRIKSTYNEEK